MKNNSIIQSKFELGPITGICPVCYTEILIGTISGEITVHLDQCADPHLIDVSAYPIVNVAENKSCYFARHAVNTICPNCHNAAIPVDSGIADIIALLNMRGYYTSNSCDGDNGTVVPYIMFYDYTPEFGNQKFPNLFSADGNTMYFESDIPLSAIKEFVANYMPFIPMAERAYHNLLSRIEAEDISEPYGIFTGEYTSE